MLNAFSAGNPPYFFSSTGFFILDEAAGFAWEPAPIFANSWGTVAFTPSNPR